MALTGSAYAYVDGNPLTLIVFGWFFRAVGRLPGPDPSDPSLSALERVGAARGAAAPRLAPRLLQIGFVSLIAGLVSLAAGPLI